MNKKGERQYGLDIIKIIGASLVITVHHFNTIGFYDTVYNGGYTMYLATALYIVALSCVPLFLISTGYLLSNRKIEIQHYKKILYFLLEIFSIYFVLYIFILISDGNFSFNRLIKSSVKTFLNPGYYVGLYFSLYLIAPFLNNFYYSLNKQEKKLFIVLLVLVISVPKAINSVFKITFFDTRPSSIWSVLYYFIGVHIRETQPEIKKVKNILFLLITMLTYSVIMNKMMYGKKFDYILGYYENIFAVISATLIFIFWYDTDVQNKFALRILPILSSMTLTFYLASGRFSDPRAFEYINIGNTLLYNIPTIIPRVIFSMLYSLPIGLIVYCLNIYIYRKTKHLI